MRNELLPATPDEDHILVGMAHHQTWGFTFPTLSFFVPYFYWRKNRHYVSTPEKIAAAKSILNFQLTWCFLMLAPFIALATAFLLPGLWQYLQEYAMYRNGYYYDVPDPRLLIPSFIWLFIFLALKVLFCIIWATATLKIKQAFDKMDYSYRGLLSFPFFK